MLRPSRAREEHRRIYFPANRPSQLSTLSPPRNPSSRSSCRTPSLSSLPATINGRQDILPWPPPCSGYKRAMSSPASPPRKPSTSECDGGARRCRARELPPRLRDFTSRRTRAALASRPRRCRMPPSCHCYPPVVSSLYFSFSSSSLPCPLCSPSTARRRCRTPSRPAGSCWNSLR